MRRSALVIGVGSLLLLSCQETPINRHDASAPDASLSAFNIPVQPGASSQDNPETLSVSCCDVTRVVRPGHIDLVARGDDGDGVERVELWLQRVNAACNGIGVLTSETTTPTAAAVNAAPSEAKSSTTFRLVSTGLDITVPAGCNTFEATFMAWAAAHNFAGTKVETKRFTFTVNCNNQASPICQ
jgi:hypothetical protein